MGIQIGIQISLMAGMQRDGKEMCIVVGNRMDSLPQSKSEGNTDHIIVTVLNEVL